MSSTTYNLFMNLQQQQQQPKKIKLQPIAVRPSSSPQELAKSAERNRKMCNARQVPHILIPAQHFDIACGHEKACAIIGQWLRVMRSELLERDPSFNYTRRPGFAIFNISTRYSSFTINIYSRSEDVSVVELDALPLVDEDNFYRPYFPDLFSNLRWVQDFEEKLLLSTVDYESIDLNVPEGTPTIVARVDMARDMNKTLYASLFEVSVPRYIRFEPPRTVITHEFDFDALPPDSVVEDEDALRQWMTDSILAVPIAKNLDLDMTTHGP